MLTLRPTSRRSGPHWLRQTPPGCGLHDAPSPAVVSTQPSGLPLSRPPRPCFTQQLALSSSLNFDLSSVLFPLSVDRAPSALPLSGSLSAPSTGSPLRLTADLSSRLLPPINPSRLPPSDCSEPRCARAYIGRGWCVCAVHMQICGSHRVWRRGYTT